MSEKDALSVLLGELNRTSEDVREVMAVNARLRAERDELKKRVGELMSETDWLDRPSGPGWWWHLTVSENHIGMALIAGGEVVVIESDGTVWDIPNSLESWIGPNGKWHPANPPEVPGEVKS